jgi:hypothetical protein
MLRHVALVRIHIPEDAILHSHRRKNLNSYISDCDRYSPSSEPFRFYLVEILSEENLVSNLLVRFSSWCARTWTLMASAAIGRPQVCLSACLSVCLPACCDTDRTGTEILSPVLKVARWRVGSVHLRSGSRISEIIHQRLPVNLPRSEFVIAGRAHSALACGKMEADQSPSSWFSSVASQLDVDYTTTDMYTFLSLSIYIYIYIYIYM